MALWGAFNVKRNGVPAGNVVNGAWPLGRQKSTSSKPRSERKEYHP
jgi:hypothetical protein